MEKEKEKEQKEKNQEPKKTTFCFPGMIDLTFRENKNVVVFTGCVVLRAVCGNEPCCACASWSTSERNNSMTLKF